MNAQLFLAHADDHRPLLDNGLSIDTTLDAPAPDSPELPTEKLANIFAPPDDLTEQRWAIVVPAGAIGEHLLALIKPLRKKREEEQGSEALVYEVPPHMDQLAAAKWIRTEYRNKVKRNEAARPRYLALLGGPEYISWDFQQMLAGEAFVGRIAFDRDAEYEAYVEKAVRHADTRDVPRAHALFHTVFDGTMATAEADKYLMQPSLEMVREAMDAGKFDVEKLSNTSMKSPNERLESTAAINALLEGARLPASLLFSLSHGAGVPKEGWKSNADQRTLQGAMVLGNGQLLTAADVSNRPFLPLGVWFFFACFGAGTPTRSAYLPWIQKLESLGLPTTPTSELVRALPPPNQSPFVAALPRAALANPHGPLAVVGHVDLAWSWSYLDYDVDSARYIATSRADRFQAMLRALVHGHRFGVAHYDLVRSVRSVESEGTASDDEEERSKAQPQNPAKQRRAQVHRANLWMQRQDLSAYILLGDPAARLPIARHPAGIRSASRLSKAVNHSDELRRREANVLAILGRNASIDEIAARQHVSSIEVERWVDTFCEGGRLALAEDL